MQETYSQTFSSCVPINMSTSNLRLRNLGNTKAEQRSATPSPNSDQDEVQAFGVNSPAPRSISTLEVLRVLAGLFLLSSSLSYFVTNDSIFWGYKPSFTRLSRVQAWMVGNKLQLFKFKIQNSADAVVIARAPPPHGKRTKYLQRH